MLKVCMVVQKYYHVDSRVRRYAEALADIGAQVDVLCLSAPEVPPIPPRGIRVFTVPLGRPRGGRFDYIFKFSAGLVLFAAKLLPLFIRNRYQFIHIHNMPDCLVLAALIPRVFGARVILDVHDAMPEFYQSKFLEQAGGVAAALLQAEERCSAALADSVLTANKYFEANLIARGTPAKKITVINNLPDPAIFFWSTQHASRRAHTRPFTLIYPGTIAPRYGLEVAIRAVPQLAAKMNLRVLIIGEQGEHVNQLTELANTLGIAHCVQFQSHIPVEQVADAMRHADVGIYPALPDAHMCIAMPVKVLEYAAVGLPIVASSLPVLRDVFDGSSLQYFEPGNVDQFAHCINELYAHPARGEALARNAHSVLQSAHNWDNERLKYFHVLEDLAPGSFAPAVFKQRSNTPRADGATGPAGES